MNEAQIQLLREAILRLVGRNRTRFGLAAEAVSRLLAEFGFEPTPEETEFQLEYLQGKGLVEAKANTLNPKNRTWKITAAGVDAMTP